MRLAFLFFVGFLLCFSELQALPRPLLADLDLSKGEWEVVGIPLYNHQMVPEQKQYGTFTLKDIAALREMQQTWNFEPMYDDYCDYHYVLKVYRDRVLVKTLRINLACQYISEGMFSYRFDAQLLFKHQASFIPTHWATAQYSNLGVLRRALKTLEPLPQIRVYQDVKPFAYDGFFVVRTEAYPWHINRDSVLQMVQKRIAKTLGSTDFYVVPYLLFINADWQLTFRYEVFCNRSLGEGYTEADKTVNWRSHLFTFDDTIMVTYIGVNKAEYSHLLYGRADALD
jgi:hypothetical protein